MEATNKSAGSWRHTPLRKFDWRDLPNGSGSWRHTPLRKFNGALQYILLMFMATYAT
ncbi:hypothetical protein J500_2838 [Acinetobacter sp. 479375]|uniref:hypothetical protein n=1 Tax=Acinetobacter ursingii TaxID=108980 RepID=UPI0003A451C8|nr:hypothetical protein J500_2838 [Acinetobacter sp. 479375]